MYMCCIANCKALQNIMMMIIMYQYILYSLCLFVYIHVAGHKRIRSVHIDGIASSVSVENIWKETPYSIVIVTYKKILDLLLL